MGSRKRTKRKRLVVAATVGCAAVAAVPAALLATAHGATEVDQQVAVPAYLNPGSGSWDAFGGSGPAAGLLVANPDSGPGSGKDTAYAAAIAKARSRGSKVLGYVDTGYFGTSGWQAPGGGSAPDDWLRAIEKNVDTWYDTYGDSGVGGIFFDDALNKCGPGAGSTTYVDLYKKIRDYVKAKDDKAQVVVNPGTGTDECYADAADTLVTFEGSYAQYRTFAPQSWEQAADPSKIWHLVYETSESQLSDAIALSKKRNAGYVYVTADDNTPAEGQSWGNPWDTVTPYWSREVSLVASDG
ncbi:spherulation-specific family 4 protein [Streptomyces sp. NPDC048409]|uniref:spherulation-specific family 4 protein n=1 Tax=Streptomyces sp. NPDC048409 TaxID=3154723 RepID=UPI00343DDCCE